MHLFPIAVCIVVGFAGLLMRLHGSEGEAERQRGDNEHLRGVNTGLRYDLMATRHLLDGAVEAKALLRRQSRARLREARRWRDRAKAALATLRAEVLALLEDVTTEMEAMGHG